MTWSRIEKYDRKVEKGYERMRSLKIAICSLVRDCEKPLKRNIVQIEKLRQYFLESHVIIVENDSIDNTKAVLKTWSNEYENVHIISEDLGVQTQPTHSDHEINPSFSWHRINLMASYRNKYLDFLENRFEVDYVIIIDLDLYLISLDGIANTFGQSIDWYVVTSNSKMKHSILQFYKGYHYYDTYAFREVGDDRPQTESMIYTYQHLLAPLAVGMPMMRVASAFSGLAIYKKEAIGQLRYVCKANYDKNVEAESEHVPFHKEMANNQYDLIFINPSQIVYYDTYTNYLREFFLKLVKQVLAIFST